MTTKYREFKLWHMELEDDLKKLRHITLFVEDFVQQRDRKGKALLRHLGYLMHHQGLFHKNSRRHTLFF